jgi:hypothetical protein
MAAKEIGSYPKRTKYPNASSAAIKSERVLKEESFEIGTICKKGKCVSFSQ